VDARHEPSVTQVYVVVDYTPPTVTVTGLDIAPGSVSPGAKEVGILKLSLITDVGEATWTQVKVDLTGTAEDDDISSVEIWVDDGNGQWKGTGQDTEIGSSAFSSNSATIDITGETITTSSQDYFVVYDIAGGANPGHKARAKLLDNLYVTVSSPATVSISNFPIESSDVSLPIELSAFTATAGDGEITLRWNTESEVENLGFNIYRSAKYNDQLSIINDQLIPGAGSSSSRQEYKYVDNGLTNGVTYWYKLEDVDYSGNTELHGPISATPMKRSAPREFRLYPNYPNPFNPVTTISYDLPDDGLVELTVYNMRGEKVTTLMQGKQKAGSYMNWDGTDRNGGKVSSGIYILRIASGNYSRTSKMVFIR